jgi:hypothetical protein
MRTTAALHCSTQLPRLWPPAPCCSSHHAPLATRNPKPSLPIMLLTRTLPDPMLPACSFLLVLRSSWPSFPAATTATFSSHRCHYCGPPSLLPPLQPSPRTAFIAALPPCCQHSSASLVPLPLWPSLHAANITVGFPSRCCHAALPPCCQHRSMPAAKPSLDSPVSSPSPKQSTTTWTITYPSNRPAHSQQSGGGVRDLMCAPPAAALHWW